MENKTYVFQIHGLHCNACVILTEAELAEHPKVLSAKSSLKSGSVEIHGYFEDMSPEEIVRELNPLLSKHSLSIEKEKREIRAGEFFTAIPIAVGFVFLFILLQKLGIVNLVNSESVGYGTAFLIGVVASLSTCMAVVGGLVLSMSATFAKEGDKVRPQILFHVGRIVAFFLLGGIIGVVGSAFQLGATGAFVLAMIVGIVMLILGINLLDVFHFTKRFQPAMPKFLSKIALRVTNLNHVLTPVLAGIATFFLPCGFTQSMQIYTLSTGNFLEGGLVMLAFALGTFPVLALISFSSFTITGRASAGIFFKSAGLIVIAFALFNIINGLVSIGFVPPIFNF